jgi:TonB family protein
MIPFLRAVFFFAGLALLQSCTECNDVVDTNDCNYSGEVFSIVDKMPTFPGGSDSLNSFIKTNLVYPSSANCNEINGIVSIEFIVDKNGNVICPKVTKSLTPDCDKEALRIINAMPVWNAGTLNQKFENVYVDLDIEFIYDTTENQEPFTFIEQMPQFPGGDSARQAFFEANMMYPDSARIKKIEGTVIVQFIVDRYGNILSPNIVRSIPELDKEAIRLINIMPQWIPGRHNCRKVKVSFTLPIRFKL